MTFPNGTYRNLRTLTQGNAKTFSVIWNWAFDAVGIAEAVDIIFSTTLRDAKILIIDSNWFICFEVTRAGLKLSAKPCMCFQCLLVCLFDCLQVIGHLQRLHSPIPSFKICPWQAKEVIDWEISSECRCSVVTTAKIMAKFTTVSGALHQCVIQPPKCLSSPLPLKARQSIKPAI